MARILLTRPRDRAEPLAAELRDAGWEVEIWPLLAIRPTGAVPDYAGAQALVFTSARGVEALTTPPPPLPAWCVGPATAEAARAAGLTDVRSGPGDASGLAARIAADLDTGAGAVTHPRGAHAAFELAEALRAEGFEARETVVYEAAAPATDPRIAATISAGGFDKIAFYSPRAAEVFAGFAEAGWREGLAATEAIAISAAAARPLAALNFRRVEIAATPDGAAMRAAIDGAEKDGPLFGANGRTRVGADKTRETAVMGDPRTPDESDGRADDRAEGRRDPAMVETPDNERPREDAPDLAATAGDPRPEDDAPDLTSEAVDDDPLDEASDRDRRDDGGARHGGGRRSGGFASKLLIALLLLIAGAALALWAAPRVAPELPAFAAPLTEYLAPQQSQLEEARAARDALETRVTGLEARIAEGEAVAAESGAAVTEVAEGVAGDLAAAEARLNERIDEVAAARGVDQEALDAIIELDARVTEVENTLQGLRSELDSLAGFAEEGTQPSSETLERVAAFGASVEGLRGEQQALRERLSQIGGLAEKETVAALQERVAALEESDGQAQAALDEAEQARRRANLDAALSRVDTALAQGGAYDAPLGEAVEISGRTPPEALSGPAEGGIATLDALTESLPDAAREAIRAERAPEEGAGAVDRVLGAIQAQLQGRPTEATEGDDAGAVLSRVEARMKADDLTGALAEAEALSETARQAMSGWLERARAREAAGAALAEYRAGLGG